MKIERSKKFLKDVKRIKQNSKRSTWSRIEERLTVALEYITRHKDLPADFYDHEISNHRLYDNCRDCHILGDLVMLHRVEAGTVEILSIMRLGSHNQLRLSEGRKISLSAGEGNVLSR